MHCGCFLNNNILQIAGGLLIIIILVIVFVVFMVRTRRKKSPIEGLPSMTKGDPCIENKCGSVVTRPSNKSKVYNVRGLNGVFFIECLMLRY